MKSASKIAMYWPRATLQPLVQGASLEAGAIGSMDVLDVDALRRMTAHRQLGDLARLVGRIVQYLDLETIARVVDAAHGIDEPIDDVHFVVERELNGNGRQRIEHEARHGLLVLVLHVAVDQVIPVPAVSGQDK